MLLCRLMSKGKFGWLLCLVLHVTFAATSLRVDQAFPLIAGWPEPQALLVQWNIQEGYYLYRDRIQITSADEQVKLGEPHFPPAAEHENQILGRFYAYDKPVRISVPVQSAQSTQFKLQIKYQGCSTSGYCYPPQTRLMTLTQAAGNPLTASELAIDRIPSEAKASEMPAPAQALWRHHYQWSVWLGFFGLGLLISLTPCVLPMIPLLSGLILGKARMTHGRAFLISLAYVLGMAVTYAVAGVLFGLIGASVQTFLQKPWIIVAFSGFFMAMALSLWGVYYLQVPETLRNWVSRLSQRQHGGSLIGAATMGGLSTLVLSPCATPALVAVLTYIGQTGKASLGGLALFVIGLGSGVPLLLVGAFGRRLLPKSGPWMWVVENILGIILAGMAIWMLERILPDRIILILWSGLAIGCAIYLKTFSSAATRLQLIGKGLGILIFIYGILLLVGAMQGATNPFQPLKTHFSTHIEQAHFIAVRTVADIQKQMEKAEGRPVLIDFYADWCVSCQILEKEVFKNPAVQEHLRGFLLLRADITAHDAGDLELMRHYNVIAPPTLIIFNQQHQEVPNARMIGEISPALFLKKIRPLQK